MCAESDDLLRLARIKRIQNVFVGGVGCVHLVLTPWIIDHQMRGCTPTDPPHLQLIAANSQPASHRKSQTLDYASGQPRSLGSVLALSFFELRPCAPVNYVRLRITGTMLARDPLPHKCAVLLAELLVGQCFCVAIAFRLLHPPSTSLHRTSISSAAYAPGSTRSLQPSDIASSGRILDSRSRPHTYHPSG